MTDRPIIFSGPMVRALLAGRKTQTRRLVAPQPTAEGWRTDGHGQWYPYTDATSSGGLGVPGAVISCPYGAPGDRLWVREAFWQMHDLDSDGYQTLDCGPNLELESLPIEYVASPESDEPPGDGREVEPYTGKRGPGNWWVCPPDNWDGTDADREARGRWQFLPWTEPHTKFSPIHMPRWASRITLAVVSVRVERLQAITEEDARAEGVLRTGGRANLDPHHFRPARDLFADLWDSINVKRAPWSSNPWVWRVEFRREVAP